MFALKPLTLLLFVLLCNTLTAQVSCVPVFFKEQRAAVDIMPADIKNLSDGTFIIAGKGQQTANAPYDGLVTKISATGNVIWSFLIGGIGQDAFTGVAPLNDGGFLLYGTTSSYGYTSGKAWLVRIDNAGSLIWSRQLGNGVTGTDRVKAVQQFSDGDIIGTYNANDSTALSDPVVFKMGIDGTLKWSHIFNQGDNDSFTSIAFAGNVIYTGGFYTINKHRAVIVKLNAGDGSFIAANNIYKKDISYDHEIFGLEVYNNSISYGLWMRKGITTTNFSTELILVRTDMADNTRFQLTTGVIIDTLVLMPKRTADDGFLVLSATRGNVGTPTVIKINQYGKGEWGNLITQQYVTETNTAISPTNDGGCIAVGYYKPPFGARIMSLMRMNENGEYGPCRPGTNGSLGDTTSYSRQPFSWAVETGYTPAINELVTPNVLTFGSTENILCESSFCTDRTPLPPDCNKTYHLQLSATRSLTIRDAVTTPDGGKIAVGDKWLNGIAIKYNANGDVAWSKQYEAFFRDTRFRQIIRSADGNYIIFANSNISVNHGSSSCISMVKVDINGNIIWTRNINEWTQPTVGDVAPAPDGGFVLVGNNSGTYSFAIRFDANVNMIWKKTFTGVFNPSYGRAYCNNGEVYITYANPFFTSTACFGVEKLDLATGNRIWSNLYTAGGPNSTGLINRIFVINDTSYVFITHTVPLNSFDKINSPVLVKINPNGSFAQGFLFSGDNGIHAPYITQNYDDNPPTVTLTPNNDFILTTRVVAGTDTLLSIARIGNDGKVAWAGNFAGTKDYTPFNIQPQGKGVVIMGSIRMRYIWPYTFTDAFFIKADSLGQINYGGGCSNNRSDRPLNPSPLGFTVTTAPHTVQEFNYYTPSAGTITNANYTVDATLLCHTPANCNIVAAIPKGGGCSLADTLTYLLNDKADCYAAVTWKYDPSFFKLVSMNGDSIRVVPTKTGVFTINARIEGSCVSTNQQITSAIGIAASQVSLGNDALICAGQQIKLSAGPGYSTYKWNDNSTDSTLIATQPGKYYVDVTDNCGGSGTDTLLVNDAGLVFKITGNTTKCNSDTIQLQASGGYNNYQWKPQINLQAANNTAQVSPATTTKYYATAEKWPGCQVIDSILITTLSSPPVNLPADVSICPGDSVIVQAAPGFNAYQWNTGETQSAIIVKSAGAFTVAATFSNGCQSKDTFRLLSLYPLPVPALDKSPVLCYGGTRVLQPAQTYNSYQWSDGSTGPSIEVKATGMYWVAVADGHGCKGSDTARITTIAPLPADFLPADTAICQYAKFTLAPRQTYKSYLWNDFSNSVALTVKKPGLYWVRVTDQNNCTGSDSITIGGKDCMEGLFVPNAFTPNGDRQNDVFRALIFGNVTTFAFIIFNRWGGRVFETHDPAAGWDGKINGQPAQKGTYIWYCRYTLEGLPEKTEKGIVELVQ